MVEEHRYGQDGRELANAADRHDPGPETAVEQAGVSQYRQKHPEGRGSESQAYHQGVEDRPDHGQHRGDDQGQTQRDHPSGSRQLQGTSTDARQIELDSGEEHQVRQPHVPQGDGDAGGVSQAKDSGSDHDA